MLVLHAQDGDISPGLALVHSQRDFSMFQHCGTEQLRFPLPRGREPPLVLLDSAYQAGVFGQKCVGKWEKKLLVVIFLPLPTKGSTNFSTTLSSRDCMAGLPSSLPRYGGAIQQVFAFDICCQPKLDTKFIRLVKRVLSELALLFSR